MTENRENALETELLRVFALLHSLSDLIVDHDHSGRPLSMEFVSDRLDNTFSGMPAPPEYENRAKETLRTRIPSKIAPGSVWRRKDGNDWVEYVIEAWEPWSGRTGIVSHRALMHGIKSSALLRTYEDDFLRGFVFVHGPTGPTQQEVGAATPATSPPTPGS